MKKSVLALLVSMLSIGAAYAGPQAASAAAAAPSSPVAAAAVTVPAVDAQAAAAAGAAGSASAGAAGNAASATAYDMPPPPVNLLSGKDSTLTARELQSVRIANQWKNEQFQPGSGGGGRVMFRFGATLPSIVCAPLHVCSIDMQAGETIKQIDVGDAVRWIITPSVTGDGDAAVSHVIVKVTDTDLTTNMIVSTNRRQYIIQLVSRKNDWMPAVAFSYPEDEAAQWAAYRAAVAKVRTDTIMPDTGQNLATLDFGFKLSGDAPAWRPVRVYTDGVKTYIQFPRSMKFGDSPVLVGLGPAQGYFSGPTPQLVNYRVVGDRYVVDKVLDHAALISGVGHAQQKVVITRGN